eukprot:scaffold85966_cov76-Cyclotella_meneghiniana.AAC.1
MKIRGHLRGTSVSEKRHSSVPKSSFMDINVDKVIEVDRVFTREHTTLLQQHLLKTGENLLTLSNTETNNMHYLELGAAAYNLGVKSGEGSSQV